MSPERCTRVNHHYSWQTPFQDRDSPESENSNIHRAFSSNKTTENCHQTCPRSSRCPETTSMLLAGRTNSTQASLARRPGRGICHLGGLRIPPMLRARQLGRGGRARRRHRVRDAHGPHPRVREAAREAGHAVLHAPHPHPRAGRGDWPSAVEAAVGTSGT